MAARAATSGLGPLAARENTMRCPAAVDRGRASVSGDSLNAMVRPTYSAVSATEPASSHSQSRVVPSLANSAATRRRTSAHRLQGGRRSCAGRGGPAPVAGEGEEQLLQVAVGVVESVQLDPLDARDVPDLGRRQSDHAQT